MKFDNTDLKILILKKFQFVENMAFLLGLKPKKLYNKLNSKCEFTAFEINKMVHLLEIAPKDINRYFFTVIEPQ